MVIFRLYRGQTLPGPQSWARRWWREEIRCVDRGESGGGSGRGSRGGSRVESRGGSRGGSRGRSRGGSSEHSWGDLGAWWQDTPSVTSGLRVISLQEPDKLLCIFRVFALRLGCARRGGRETWDLGIEQCVSSPRNEQDRKTRCVMWTRACVPVCLSHSLWVPLNLSRLSLFPPCPFTQILSIIFTELSFSDIIEAKRSQDPSLAENVIDKEDKRRLGLNGAAQKRSGTLLWQGMVQGRVQERSMGGPWEDPDMRELRRGGRAEKFYFLLLSSITTVQSNRDVVPVFAFGSET